MKPFEFYDEAETELEDALSVSAARSPRIAVEFRQTVARVLDDLRSGLLTAARFPGTDCREYPLTRFPYSIVYLDDPDAIRVVAFAHHKRRRGYWKSRLPRT